MYNALQVKLTDMKKQHANQIHHFKLANEHNQQEIDKLKNRVQDLDDEMKKLRQDRASVEKSPDQIQEREAKLLAVKKRGMSDCNGGPTKKIAKKVKLRKGAMFENC